MFLRPLFTSFKLKQSSSIDGKKSYKISDIQIALGFLKPRAYLLVKTNKYASSEVLDRAIILLLLYFLGRVLCLFERPVHLS